MSVKLIARSNRQSSDEWTHAPSVNRQVRSQKVLLQLSPKHTENVATVQQRQYNIQAQIFVLD